MQKLVIIGAGFAGMWAALVAAREVALAQAVVAITLIAPDDHLTVRPRLYEPLTAAMRAPLAPVFAPLGIELRLASASAIDGATRTVDITDSEGAKTTLSYDRLVLAAGSVQRPLPVPGVDQYAQDIDTYRGAARLDAHLARILAAPNVDGNLTFVIVGGGFTGIELATEMRNRLRQHGHAAAAGAARVLLIERQAVIGPDLGAAPRPHIDAALAAGGVEVRLGASVSAIEAHAVLLTDGEKIPCGTVILTTGLAAHPLAAKLGGELDAQGRVMVDAELRVRGAMGIYAAGDVAHAAVDAEHVALMSCQHAIPMGKYAGYNAARDLLGLPLRAYSQPHYVTFLDLGDFGALYTSGWERKTEQVGSEVKALKKMINTQWIYPPRGDRAALLAAADLDAPWPPAV